MHESLLRHLRSAIDLALGPLVPAGAPVALLDFPGHPNAGDSAIWLGEAAWLRANRNTRKYVCDVDAYDPRVLRRRCPDGPLLLHGGGNFGDLWPRYQRLRETVAADFPDRRIVQLPQTIRFEDPAGLDAARRIFGRHPHFTLMVRDHRSLAIARELVGERAVLCPDMAFCLAPSLPAGRPAVGVVFLKRTDRESNVRSPIAAPPGAAVVDWLDEPADWRRTLSRLSAVLSRRYPNRVAPLAPWLADTVAGWRVDRGIRVLTQGERVITDRLHAHILCVLLGIPHTVVDNSYGKLSSFIDTWTSGTCDVAWQAS
jgi:pyruvyl transferase EpsO